MHHHIACLWDIKGVHEYGEGIMGRYSIFGSANAKSHHKESLKRSSLQLHVTQNYTIKATKYKLQHKKL